MEEWSSSITEEDKTNAKKSGIDLDKILKSLGTVVDKGTKAVVGAMAIEGVRQLVTDPAAFIFDIEILKSSLTALPCPKV